MVSSHWQRRCREHEQGAGLWAIQTGFMALEQGVVLVPGFMGGGN
jgi:hypothetical protein